jgi:dTDP-4-dehydrorhamnose reductase
MIPEKKSRMKILLFGAMGQLGMELQSTLSFLGEIAACDIHNLNLERTADVIETIRKLGPDVIVNASAYTAVDQAESEPEKAFYVNGRIPGLLADETARLNALLIHYSTDYLFDGRQETPYCETDLPNPLGVYGSSKLQGEEEIRAGSANYLILRTSWVYSRNRSSFVTKVLEWARKQEVMSVVDDQVSNPTWAYRLADVTARLLSLSPGILGDRRGVYHVAGNGYTSRLDWARKIIELDPNRHEQKVRKILAARTSDFPMPAQRPLFSALDCSLFQSTFEISLPRWEDDLQQAMSA